MSQETSGDNGPRNPPQRGHNKNDAQQILAWGKISPDEPVFIIRARDALAVPVIKYWIERAQKAGVNPEKGLDAIDCVEAFVQWQARHGAKVPD